MSVFTSDSSVSESELSDSDVPTGKNGYNQSKWVAGTLSFHFSDVQSEWFVKLEVLVFLLLSIDLVNFPCRDITQIGTIGPHSATGCFNSSDFVTLVLRQCVQLKKSPKLSQEEADINLCPVDFVSKGIVQLSLSTHAQKIFNFVNFNEQTSWKSIFQALNFTTKVFLLE